MGRDSSILLVFHTFQDIKLLGIGVLGTYSKNFSDTNRH